MKFSGKKSGFDVGSRLTNHSNLEMEPKYLTKSDNLVKPKYLEKKKQ